MVMTVLVLCSGVLGGLLASRYKVLILVPVIVFGCAAIAIGGAIAGAPGWSMVIAIVLSAVSLQVGYLIGLFVTSQKRHILVAGKPSLLDRRSAV